MKSKNFTLEEFLEKNKESTSLVLNGKMIGNAGTEKIALQFIESHNLKELWLAKNQIDNEGLENIVNLCENNPNITYLDLRENRINANGIEGIISLLKNSNLSELYLSQNSLGDAAIKKIAQHLITNDSLTYLGLTSVKMHDEGFTILTEAFQRNSTIKGVDFLAGRRNTDYIFKGPHSKKTLENLFEENSQYPEKALARKVAYQILDIFIDQKDIALEEKLNFLKCYEKANKDLLEEKLNILFSASLNELEKEISQFIEENINSIAQGQVIEKVESDYLVNESITKEEDNQIDEVKEIGNSSTISE